MGDINERTIKTYCCNDFWKLVHIKNKGYFLCCNKCGKRLKDQVGEDKGVSLFVVSKKMVRDMSGLFD